MTDWSRPLLLLFVGSRLIAAQAVVVTANLTVSPSTVSLRPSQAQQFQILGRGRPLGLTWSISPAVGSITAGGLYTAPPVITAQQTVTVTARTPGGATASAVVTLLPAITVTVAPAAATLRAGQSQQFTASVGNTSDQRVTWSVTPAVGTVSSSGLYRAPLSIPAQQTVTVVARSVADPGKSGAAAVTLMPAPITVSVTPATATLSAGQTQQFTASVGNTSDQRVTWSVTPAVGSLSSSGLYTAPPSITTAQQVTVTATSVADSTKWASASVALRADTTVVDRIRTEALAPNNPSHRPLPLLGSWNASTQWSDAGFSPSYQMQLIDAGHYLLPWFEIALPSVPQGSPEWCAYYETAIRRAATLNLPISFIGTEWEHLLYDDPAYLNLPVPQNPNVLGLDGKIQPKLSPFGALAPWQQVGANWGGSWMMSKLQEWYPNPPLVLFVSNNEATKLAWTETEQDSRYLALYGTGRDGDFKRSVVADGWVQRYRALQGAFRAALVSPAWRANAVFAGYHAYGPSWFARWDQWKDYSLYVPARVDPSPIEWDGGSPPYYLSPGIGITDFTVFCPQVEAMNWVFMEEETSQLNPDFWFEFSSWDGAAPQWPDDMRRYYTRIGQTFTPERYGGMVQFGLWLLRPRLLREFRFHDDTRADYEPYLLALVAAVDRLYNNATLEEFWRGGTLVANRAHLHPYESDLPGEYSGRDRWFLLDTNLDPPRPWSMDTPLPVYSLAFSLGSAPSRRWLIYAQSPLGDRAGVQIMLPDFGTISVGVQLAGSFYLVDEPTRRVTALAP